MICPESHFFICDLFESGILHRIMCPIAVPGVASSIPARSHTFVRLIMKSFLWSFSTLPLNHSRRVDVSYKQKYVHKVLVNCMFEVAQDKSVVR